MYQSLLEEDDNFEGFDLAPGTTFNDQRNRDVVSKLVKEVQLSNQSFQASQIRAATYTYYRTLTQEDSLKRRGKYEERKRIRRRRERLLRV